MPHSLYDLDLDLSPIFPNFFNNNSQLTQKRVDAIAWMLSHEGLAHFVLEQGEIQEGGFRCPAHLAKQFDELLEGQDMLEVRERLTLLLFYYFVCGEGGYIG